MVIAKRTPLYLQSLLLASSISLVACGGGGGSSSSAKASDTTPDALSFTASTNVQPNVIVTSPAVAISGIDALANVSISGGEYSINGAAFTSTAGKISNGQSLVVRVIASDKTNTANTATVTVGGVSAQFSVTTQADVTPAGFILAPVTNAAPGAAVTSSAITLSEFDIAVPVSITGGEYSINGGAFTSAAGTVSPAQSVVVKLMASNNHSTATNAQLTVGGVSASFSVTTLPDSTPDTFSFTAKTNAALNTVYTSIDAITVKGIDTAVPVSITGGEYSVNGAAFTSAAGTVSVNDSVTVRATAANGTELTHNAVLTIGNVPGTFAITTIPDTTAPVAEFKFPTPYTMSEASSVIVRGIATDEHAIASVKLVVNGTTEVPAIPKAAGDFSSWTATVPLTVNSENEIKVIATDHRNNSIDVNDANKIAIRQADLKSPFPDEINPLDTFSFAAFDNQGGRNRVLVADRGKILAVDIKSGQRTVFINHHPACIGSQKGLLVDHKSSRIYAACSGKTLNEYDLIDGSLKNSYSHSWSSNSSGMFGIALDRNNGRNQLVLVDNTYEYDETIGSEIVSFSLDSKQFSVISANSELPRIEGSFGAIAINGNNYLLTSGGQHEDTNLHRIINVDAITGKHTVYADNSTGSGVLFNTLLPDNNTAALVGIVIDKKNNRVLTVETISSRLLAIDMQTGERSLFKDLSYLVPNSPYEYESSLDLDLDEENGMLLLPDSRRDAIIIIDLETREKVILSKARNS